MDITDSHIKHLQACATLNEAIRLCQETIAETARWEASCRGKRIELEAMLGELIAQKMLLELHPPV